jgi:hypothetical protein
MVCDSLAIEMHNTFEKQDGVHGDTIDPGLSLNLPLSWKPFCPFIARTFTVGLRERRVRVTTGRVQSRNGKHDYIL